MYNIYLKTFIEVVNQGSITKASETLFISPTAVMKQMNQLEDSIGVKLLIRSKKGIDLTDAGKIIYKEAKYIIKYCDKVIDKAKNVDKEKNYIVKVGTSLICPCTPLMDIWYEISEQHPEFKIQIIPFEEKHTNTLLTFKNNNTDIDFIVSPCDSKAWLENYNFLQLGTCRFCLAVPYTHKLAKKEIIDLKDLSNETIMLITGGDSPINNEIKKYIEDNCSNVELKTAPFFYDINVFNECVDNGYLLITLDCWKNVQPLLRTIPFIPEKSNYYGVLYSKTPTHDALKFIELIQNTLNEKTT